MGKTGKSFGGKKAAPFKKGGGRNTLSPRKANGQPRKGKSRGSITLATILEAALIVLVIVLIIYFYNRT